MRESKEKTRPIREARDNCCGDPLTAWTGRWQNTTFMSTGWVMATVCDHRGGHADQQLPKPAWVPEVGNKTPQRSWPQRLQLLPSCKHDCPHLPWNLCSLTLLRDPWARVNSPGRVHDLPQAIPTFCMPMLLQALPTHSNCICHNLPSPWPNLASES